MKNIINYYYNFNIDNIYLLDNKYYFNYNNINYYFIKVNKPIEEINALDSLYKEIKKRGIFSNELIPNKTNNYITRVNNEIYILVKDNTKNYNININDILYIQNNTLNISKDRLLIKNDWIRLWTMKVDFYEEQEKSMLSKYKLLNETIDYYIGLTENAISYLTYNHPINNNLVLSHRRIKYNTNSFDYYNPINYILDNRVRDFSEYIKSSFFENNFSFESFKTFLDYLNFNREEYILLISRLLYPSYYFDIYDSIIKDNLDENIIKKVLVKNKDYILFLQNTFDYIINIKRINIPIIEWIIRFV